MSVSQHVCVVVLLTGGLPEGLQKTKSCSWTAAAGEDDQIHALEVVTDFVYAMYHRHFQQASDYVPSYSRQVLGDVSCASAGIRMVGSGFPMQVVAWSYRNTQALLLASSFRGSC